MTMPLEGRRRRLTVVSWNAKVGRRNRVVGDLRKLIRDTDPDVVLLQEAQNYIGLIRLRFPRWRLYAVTRWKESANCPVMVRRSIRRGRRRGRGWGVVRNHVPWTYTRTGKRHPGRTWTWVRVDWLPVMSVHRSVGQLGTNHRAGAEESEALRDWFAERYGPAFAAGDFNGFADDKRPDAADFVARKSAARIFIPENGRIDYGIGRDVEVTATRGDKYGSDHHAVIFIIRRKA